MGIFLSGFCSILFTVCWASTLRGCVWVRIMVTVAAGGDPVLPAPLACPIVAFFREWIGNGNGDHPLINPGPWGGENAGPAKTTLACRRRTPCSVDWPRYELLRTHHVGPARANWNAQHEFNAVRSTMYVQVYAQFVPRSLFLPLLNSPFPALPAAMKSSLLLVPTRSPECPSPLKLC